MDGLTTDYNGLLMLSRMPCEIQTNVFEAPHKFSEAQSTKTEVKHIESYYWMRKEEREDAHELQLEKVMSQMGQKSKLNKLLQADRRYQADQYNEFA